MGLEYEDMDGNGVGKLESPFYAAGLYNSLEDEKGGLHWSGDRPEACLSSLTFLSAARLMTWEVA